LAVANAASHQIPPASNLFPLDASRSALEKKTTDSANQQLVQLQMMQQLRQQQEERENFSPSLAVAQTPFVRVAGEMIMNSNDDPWDQ